MRPPTCSDCAQWRVAVVVRNLLGEVRLCRVTLREVRAEDEAPMLCFRPIIVFPAADRPRE
jgi:hypothetical protein